MDGFLRWEVSEDLIVTQGYSRLTLKDDLEYLATNMRDADKAELQATIGWQPLPALQFALNNSEICKTALTAEGEPVMIYGVTPSDTPGLGVIWMLGTDGIQKVQTTFLRECRKEIMSISSGYSAVFNYTDARNTLHHRWLKWCGFTFLNKQNYGVEGRPFYQFVKIIGA